MYLLVTVKDTSQISDAITVLLQSGFTQFTTGETMEDICTECQSRKEHCQMNTTSSFTEEIKPEKMCSEVGIKMEEPGVPAEDLLFGDDYEDEIDDIEPDYLDMEPTSSRRSNAPVHLADDLDYSELGDSTQYSDLNDEEDNALDMANSLSLQNRKRKIDKNGGAVASLDKGLRGLERVEILCNHLMRLQRMNKGGTNIYYCYWRNRDSVRCPATYRYYESTKSVEVMLPHNHEANEDVNKKVLIKYRQKELAKLNPRMRPKAIIEQACKDFHMDDKEAAGSYESQRRRIQRVKSFVKRGYYK